MLTSVSRWLIGESDLVVMKSDREKECRKEILESWKTRGDFEEEYYGWKRKQQSYKRDKEIGKRRE